METLAHLLAVCFAYHYKMTLFYISSVQKQLGIGNGYL
jgi:hypothetical protein